MKLSGRIVFQNVAGIVAIGCVSLVVALLNINRGFDKQAEEELSLLSTNVQQDLEQHQREAIRTARAMASDPDLLAALEKGDGAALRKLAREALKQGELSVTTIADASGKALARGHSDTAGDNISTQETVRQAANGEIFSTIENGAQTKMALRTGCPVRKDNRIIGCVITGYSLADSNQFVDAMKQRYGVECTLFENDTRISTTIQQNGQRAMGTRMDNPAVLDTVLKQGHSYKARNTILNQHYNTVYLPLANGTGQIVGMLFVGRPRAQQEAIISQIVLWSIVANGVVCAAAILWAMVTARRLGQTIQCAVSQVRQGTEDVDQSAQQISQASEVLAKGASEQAASIEETSSSLEEISSMTRASADNAQKTAGLARTACSAADKGMADMERMNQAIGAIKSSSNEIAKIIKTIDEIAFQTNILALNAAVEAARAGEAGMGFAVVADEVRSLAQRSAQAAKETSKRIQGAITSTAQGVEISHQVRTGLQEIVTMVHQVDKLVAEMTNASTEQSRGIAQINSAVVQMDKVTQNVAAQAEETAGASRELTNQMTNLRQAGQALQSLVEGTASLKAANQAASKPVATTRQPATRANPNKSLRAASRLNSKGIELAGKG